MKLIPNVGKREQLDTNLDFHRIPKSDTFCSFWPKICYQGLNSKAKLQLQTFAMNI